MIGSSAYGWLMLAECSYNCQKGGSDDESIDEPPNHRVLFEGFRSYTASRPRSPGPDPQEHMFP